MPDLITQDNASSPANTQGDTMHDAVTEVFKIHVIEDGEDVLRGVGGEAGAIAEGFSGVAEILASVARDYARRARKLRGQEKPMLDMLIWIERDGWLHEAAEFVDTPGATRGVLSALAEQYALDVAEGLSAEQPSRAGSHANRGGATERPALTPYTLEVHLEHRRQFPDRNSLQALLTPNEFAQLQAEGGISL